MSMLSVMLNWILNKIWKMTIFLAANFLRLSWTLGLSSKKAELSVSCDVSFTRMMIINCLTSWIQTFFPGQGRTKISIRHACNVKVCHIVVLFKEKSTFTNKADCPSKWNDSVIDILNYQVIFSRWSWRIDASNPYNC